jgi:hypothetical protein
MMPASRVRVVTVALVGVVASGVTAWVAGCGSSGSFPALSVGSDAEEGGTFQGSDDAGAAPGTLHVTIATKATTVCPGECVTLTPSATGGTPPISYRWSPAGSDSSTAGPIQVCPSKTTTYTVTATDSSGTVGEIVQNDLTSQAHATVMVGSTCADAGPPVIDSDCDSLAASFVSGDAGANPAPPWTYGWTPSLGGAFTVFPAYYPVTPITNGPFQGPGWPLVAQWFDPANGEPTQANGWSVPPIPDITFNPTSAPVQPAQDNFAGNGWTQGPMQISLTPGSPGKYAVARWTAPAAGTYGVVVTFAGVTGSNGSKKATTDVHVQHLGKDLPGGTASINAGTQGNAFSFLSNVVVATAEPIDFAVGDGGDGVIFDMTGVDAKVCRGTAATPR